VLMLFFLMLCCWYGSSVLFIPFYAPLKRRIQTEGWKIMDSNGIGPLNAPMPHILIIQIYNGTLSAQALVDLVFPLVCGIGVLITWFFALHVRLVLYARTSLEHKILLENRIAAMLRDDDDPSKPDEMNPYDRGFWNNANQVLGWNAITVLLPISIDPPPPIIPKLEKSQ